MTTRKFGGGNVVAEVWSVLMFSQSRIRIIRSIFDASARA